MAEAAGRPCGDSCAASAESLARVGAVVDALVDDEAGGVVLLGAGGRILWTNRRAEGLLREGAYLLERDGRLVASSADDAEVLDLLIGAACKVRLASGGGGSTTVGAWPDLRPLTVHVRPVGGSAGGGGGSSSSRPVCALVAILDPWMKPQPDQATVARSLGLTPGESLVACALAEGDTVRDIAHRTNRVPDSVRGVVKQALSKAWSPRQADLVRRVLSVSSMPLRGSDRRG